jgi:predicted nucleic acid-binding protein
MADSIMQATAHAFGATFWSQDADFERVDGVRYLKKRGG